MCIRCMAILLLTSYLSYGLLSPMIVLNDVSLSHLFVFLPHHYSLSPFKCQLFCFLSSIALVLKVEREWLSMTCAWVVVWGRVIIRFQRRPQCQFLFYVVFLFHVFPLLKVPNKFRKNYIPGSLRKHQGRKGGPPTGL